MSLFGEVIPTDLKNNLTATVAPTVNDDKSEGYQVLSQWVVNDVTIYECADNTVGAAVWNAINVAGGGTSYQDDWDASTNTPTLADGTGTAGDFYVVNVAGTQNLGSGDQEFSLGDQVIYNSSDIWKKQDTGVSYVPEDEANKATDFTTLNDTLYPTVQASETRVNRKTSTYTSMSGTLQLTASSSSVQVIFPNGAHRIVKAEDNPSNKYYIIENIDEVDSAEFQDFSGTKIGRTIQPDTTGFFINDATQGWLQIITNKDIDGVALGVNSPITEIFVDSLKLASSTLESLDGLDLNLTSDSGTIDVNDILKLNDASYVASEILATDGSGNVVTLPAATYPSLTELAYVKGVTSSIQDQLDAGGGGSSTLQDAYDLSSQVQILTDATRAALQIKRGSAANTDTIIEGLNGGGTVTFSVDGNGLLTVADDLVASEDVLVGDPTSTKGIQLRSQGNIELIRDDSLGHIDFKTLNADDYDCRIIQDSNGLKFTVGGAGNTLINSLILASSGDATIEKNLSANAVNTSTNRQTITGALTLVATSAQRQSLVNNTSDLNVNLPTAATDMSFVIANNVTSTFNLDVKDSGGTLIVEVAPGVTIGVWYDGTEWMFN